MPDPNTRERGLEELMSIVYQLFINRKLGSYGIAKDQAKGQGGRVQEVKMQMDDER